MSELGIKLREARERAGISQRELAIRARTSQSAISRIENGLEEPSFARFTEVMRSLGYAPALSFERLAEPDADRRRILEESRKTPQERIDDGLNWLHFLRQVPEVSAGGR
jgi:transcriptional regulator with XRE-family HTH domain